MALLRIPTLECAVWAIGRAQHAAECASEPDPELRALMIDGLVLESKQKQFANLTLQEGRLQRHLEKLIAQFKDLRAERESMQLVRRDQLMDEYIKGPHPFDPARFGFEFSKEYIEGRLDARFYRGRDFLAHFDRAWRDKSRPTAA